MITLKISTDFSEFPGLRNCDISDESGEEFYHQILNAKFGEAYKANDTLHVDLDDTAGYASSFLDQAFGNLVYDFSLNEVKRLVKIISNEEPHWKEMLENKTFPEWEKRRKDNKPPKVTKVHEPWFRLIGKNLDQRVWEQSTVV